MSNKEKVSWGTIFGVSSVAFGIHVGGGFATGNQTVNFFVKYGWTAIFMPIIAMLILNLVFRSGLINAQINKTGNYREWSDAVFSPVQVVFSNIYEVCYIIILLLAVSASIAGAGSLLETYGIPYALGVLITGVLFFVLTIFGKEFIAKASTFMTVCIVVCLLILCILGLSTPGASLSEMAKPSNAPLGIGAAIWSMLQYAGYQAYTAATISPYAATLKNKDGVNKFAVLNFLLNGVMITLSSIMLLAWLPEIQGDTLPILSIAMKTGHGWLRHVYGIVLFFAFISTGIGCIFGFVTRFENKVLVKQLPNITVRRGLISLVSMVVSMAISMLGLTVIVSKGYAYMGIIGIFLMIIPCLTFVWYRNVKGIVTSKKAKAEAENETETTA